MLYGLFFGIYVIATIALYHILVVNFHQYFGRWPSTVIFLAVGLGCVWLSFKAPNQGTSMFWGYNAFLNLWSIREVSDQSKRVLAETNADSGEA